MALPIAKQPTTKEGLLYQKNSDFVSGISIGGPAPDGAALTLDGQTTTLHTSIVPERLTILNFGSCT